MAAPQCTWRIGFFSVLKIEKTVGWVVRPRRWALGTTQRADNEKKRNTRAVSSGWVAISERPGAPGISVSFRVLKIEQAVGWAGKPPGRSQGVPWGAMDKNLALYRQYFGIQIFYMGPYQSTPLDSTRIKLFETGLRSPGDLMLFLTDG